MTRGSTDRIEDAIAFASRAITRAQGLAAPCRLDEDGWCAALFDMAGVGEALNAVAEPIKTLAPDLPWDLARGMRNHIVHEYWQIDAEVVLRTARQNLPALVADLRSLQTRLHARAIEV
ncbi:MAG TPA: HepT-like ribonuclease domain-containing protein [Beijerinckiaceae bacterium]|jgi:uncharacterized protein with HEPN domain